MQSHYFTNASETKIEKFQIDVDFYNETCQVWSAKGVFSANGLDKGTAVLIDFFKREVSPIKVDSLENKNILDLGCGWGAISLALKHLNQNCQITAVDINNFAVELTNDNFKKYEFINANAYHVDKYLELNKKDSNNKFDFIVSNPPIRIGKDELHQMLLLWLEYLKDDGVALMVVQKNLGADSLVDWLNKNTKFHSTKLSSSKGFRIISIKHSSA